MGTVQNFIVISLCHIGEHVNPTDTKTGISCLIDSYLIQAKLCTSSMKHCQTLTTTDTVRKLILCSMQYDIRNVCEKQGHSLCIPDQLNHIKTFTKDVELVP